MIVHTMVNLVIKEGPQSVPSGFGTVEQVFPAIFNENFITVISKGEAKTEAEATAQRIFYVVDIADDCPSRTAKPIVRVETNNWIYLIFAEPNPV